MKRLIPLLLGGTALVALGLLLLRSGSALRPTEVLSVAETREKVPAVVTRTEPTAEAADAAKDEPKPPTTGGEKPRAHARIVIAAGDPVPEIFPGQAERDAVMALVTSAQPLGAKIAAIAPYLQHGDATVRDTALQGLIQIGDKEAVPVIEKAAETASDPQEKERLVEAAEFLKLPSFVDIVLPPATRPQS